jgi:hypothetical protein
MIAVSADGTLRAPQRHESAACGLAHRISRCGRDEQSEPQPATSMVRSRLRAPIYRFATEL